MIILYRGETHLETFHTRAGLELWLDENSLDLKDCNLQVLELKDTLPKRFVDNLMPLVFLVAGGVIFYALFNQIFISRYEVTTFLLANMRDFTFMHVVLVAFVLTNIWRYK